MTRKPDDICFQKLKTLFNEGSREEDKDNEKKQVTPMLSAEIVESQVHSVNGEKKYTVRKD